MANYTPSNLVEVQTILMRNFADPEKRFRDPVVFKEFVRNGEIMVPSHKEVRMREDRTIEAIFKLRTSRTLGTGRSHDHTGVKGDSGILTPSFITNNDKFKTSLKTSDNNVLSAPELITNEFENVFANFAEGLEDDSADHLFNNRTTVNAATADGTFNATNDTFEITESSEGTRAAQITKTMMHENKYSSKLVVFCDTVSFNKFEFQANQGGGNSANLTFQFMNITFVHSVEMTALAATLSYVKGFWVAVPEGTISALDWIPIQNRQAVDTKENQYSTIINPVDNLTYALHTFMERENGTSTNGFTQDVKTEWEVSVDIALDNAPLTPAGESTLFAVALI